MYLTFKTLFCVSRFFLSPYDDPSCLVCVDQFEALTSLHSGIDLLRTEDRLVQIPTRFLRATIAFKCPS